MFMMMLFQAHANIWVMYRMLEQMLVHNPPHLLFCKKEEN